MPDPVRPRLKLSQVTGLDHLSALEFGAVDDGQPSDRWVGVGERVGLLHEAPDGRLLGFVVKGASTYDPDEAEYAGLWDGPRFDVPELGLVDVAPNAIFVAARALYGDGPTLNRMLFSQAVAADGEDAFGAWLMCLQSGDLMAHYALGYTLLELGRVPEAYRHLRYYSEIAPGDAWTWRWLGRAAAAMGELGEARTAYERAILIDEDATDAPELLQALLDGVPDPTFDVDEEEEDDDAPTVASVLDDVIANLWGRTHVEPTDDGGFIALLDTADGPAHLEVGPDGSLVVRAMVAPDAEEPAEHHELIPVWGTDAVSDHDVVLDPNGTAWVEHELPFGLADLEPELLRCLLIGAAAVAAEAREDARDEGARVVEPPTFDELVA